MDAGALYTEFGRGPLPGPLFEAAVLAPAIMLAADPDVFGPVVAAIADGEAVVAPILSATSAPPSASEQVGLELAGGRIRGRVRGVRHAGEAGRYLVMARTAAPDTPIACALVDASGEAVTARELPGFAPGQFEVSFHDAPVLDTAVLLDQSPAGCRPRGGGSGPSRAVRLPGRQLPGRARHDRGLQQRPGGVRQADRHLSAGPGPRHRDRQRPRRGPLDDLSRPLARRDRRRRRWPPPTWPRRSRARPTPRPAPTPTRSTPASAPTSSTASPCTPTWPGRSTATTATRTGTGSGWPTSSAWADERVSRPRRPAGAEEHRPGRRVQNRGLTEQASAGQPAGVPLRRTAPARQPERRADRRPAERADGGGPARRGGPGPHRGARPSGWRRPWRPAPNEAYRRRSSTAPGSPTTGGAADWPSRRSSKRSSPRRASPCAARTRRASSAWPKGCRRPSAALRPSSSWRNSRWLERSVRSPATSPSSGKVAVSGSRCSARDSNASCVSAM